MENFPFTPPPELTTEEMTRLGRRFRRRANLVDGSALAAVLLLCAATFLEPRLPALAGRFFGAAVVFALAFVVGGLLLYCRCPVCGNHIIEHDLGQSRYLKPVIWRMYECPVCGFTPGWSR